MSCKQSASRRRVSAFARALLAAAALLGALDGAQNLYAQNAQRPTVPPRIFPANPAFRPAPRPNAQRKQPVAPRRPVVQRNTEAQRPLQPVQWKLPEGVVASVAVDGKFVAAPDGTNTFSLRPGQVYRFKIEGMATYPGQALYPTLELLGRLNPPAGKEWDFPIEIELPTRDLALSLRGAMITRVVYVENPENALAVDSTAVEDSLTFDVPTGLDPVTAAAVRGRPLAIMRTGSRAPNGAPSAKDPFFFGLPPVGFRPGTVFTADQESEDKTEPAEEAGEPVEKAEPAEKAAEPVEEAKPADSEPVKTEPTESEPAEPAAAEEEATAPEPAEDANGWKAVVPRAVVRI